MRWILILLLSGCASYEFPRNEDGRIDEDALKREIDLQLTDNLRIDTENKELLFECKVEKWWCV